MFMKLATEQRRQELNLLMLGSEQIEKATSDLVPGFLDHRTELST